MTLRVVEILRDLEGEVRWGFYLMLTEVRKCEM